MTPWTERSTSGFPVPFTISWSLLKLISTEWVMPPNHLILCCLLLLLPSIFPSIRVFSKELARCIKWPKDWSFSISSSMNVQGWFPLGLTGLISLQSKGLSKESSLASLSIFKDFFENICLMDVHLLLQSYNPHNSRLSAANSLGLPSCMPACLQPSLLISNKGCS